MKDSAWRPDEGPFEFNAKSGATVTGVRFPLLPFVGAWEVAVVELSLELPVVLP